MAKFHVEHSCGHTESHDITGPTDRRPARAASLATGLCRDCWIAQSRAENAAALAAAEAAGLPDLEGTPKQSAWAARIRQEKLDALDGEVTNLAREMGVTGDTSPFAAMCRACLLAETSASWWIDQRSSSVHTLTVYALRAAWVATGLPTEAMSAAIRAGLLPAEAKLAYETDASVVDGWVTLAALAGNGEPQ